jgi:hypothetical protein
MNTIASSGSKRVLLIDSDNLIRHASQFFTDYKGTASRAWQRPKTGFVPQLYVIYLPKTTTSTL